MKLHEVTIGRGRTVQWADESVLSKDGELSISDDSIYTINGLCPEVVPGYLYINDPQHVNSLKGCSREVGGTFNIRGTAIKSLEHGPVKVGGDYLIQYTHITDLEGLPAVLSGDLTVTSCYELTSLEGCPSTIGGNLSVNSCTRLKTMKGGPRVVRGNVTAESAALRSFEGFPKHVGGYISLPMANHDGAFDFSNCHKHLGEVHKFISAVYVKGGMLGLLKIPGLKSVACSPNGLQTILNKYLELERTNANLLACQEELMDAGYEEAASL